VSVTPDLTLAFSSPLWLPCARQPPAVVWLPCVPKPSIVVCPPFGTTARCRVYVVLAPNGISIICWNKSKEIDLSLVECNLWRPYRVDVWRQLRYNEYLSGILRAYLGESIRRVKEGIYGISYSAIVGLL